MDRIFLSNENIDKVFGQVRTYYETKKYTLLPEDTKKRVATFMHKFANEKNVSSYSSNITNLDKMNQHVKDSLVNAFDDCLPQGTTPGCSDNTLNMTGCGLGTSSVDTLIPEPANTCNNHAGPDTPDILNRLIKELALAAKKPPPKLVSYFINIDAADRNTFKWPNPAQFSINLTPQDLVIPPQVSQGVVNVIITNGGTGYTVAPNITFTGGNGTITAASGTVLFIPTGAITSIPITTTGFGYTEPPTVTISGGGAGASGATAKAVIGQVTGPSNRGPSDYVTGLPPLENIVQIDLMNCIVPNQANRINQNINTTWENASTQAGGAVSIQQPYLYLKVAEFDGDYFTSMPNGDSVFGKLYYDSSYITIDPNKSSTDSAANRNYLIYKADNGAKKFNGMPMGHLNRLTVTIMDPAGNIYNFGDTGLPFAATAGNVGAPGTQWSGGADTGSDAPFKVYINNVGTAPGGTFVTTSHGGTAVEHGLVIGDIVYFENTTDPILRRAEGHRVTGTDTAIGIVTVASNTFTIDYTGASVIAPGVGTGVYYWTKDRRFCPSLCFKITMLDKYQDKIVYN